MLTRSTPAVTLVNKKLRLGKKADVAHFGIRRGKNGVKPHLLPIDVLSEIARHLKPMDILNLARTSRPLRSILMSKSSTFIWKESLSRVKPEVPKIPADMSIPAMVNLAFDMRCHACDGFIPHSMAASVENHFVEFELGVRFCFDCANQELVCLNGQSATYNVLRVCLPTVERTRDDRYSSTLCLHRDLGVFLDEYSLRGCDQAALIARKTEEVKHRKESMLHWYLWDMEYLLS